METNFFLRTDCFKIQTEKKIIKAEEYQVIRSAHEIIATAEQKAQDIIAQAKERASIEELKAQKIVDEASKAFVDEKKRGFAAGFDEGKIEMTKKLTEIVADTAEYIHSIEEDIVNTVMFAINKILGEIGDESIIQQLVSKTLQSVRDQKHLKLRVCPKQTDIVKKKVEEIRQYLPNIDFIEVEAEERIGLGGCILETKIGVVDASLDVQLEAIRNALKTRFMKENQNVG